MAATQSNNVRKLLLQSKQLSTLIKRKSEQERLLRELSLFKTFSALNDFDSVLTISASVIPTPFQLNQQNCSECLSLTITNASSGFTFSCQNWKFVLDLSPLSVTTYPLSSDLVPGGSEEILTSFFTTCHLSTIKVRLILLFNLSFLDQKYSQGLLVSEKEIDLLHFLSPGRIPRSLLPGNEPGPDELLHLCPETNRVNLNLELSSSNVGEEEDEGIPKVTQCFFKLDPLLLSHFLPEILLSDCRKRWLCSKGESEISRSSPLSFFYLDTEILVTCKESCGTVCLKCVNPLVLSALKAALLQRLFCLIKEGKVVLKLMEDATCEAVHSLRLRLQDLSRVKKPGEGRSERLQDLMEIYLELRDVTEGIEFRSTKVFETAVQSLQGIVGDIISEKNNNPRPKENVQGIVEVIDVN